MEHVKTNDAERTLPKARFQTDHPYKVMIGLYLGGFVGMFSETALNIAIPNLSETFNLSTAITQWMVVGYMLMIGIVLPFVSLMTKWLSARTLANLALGTFIVGAIISGVGNDFTVLLIGRMIQGIGTGIVLPLMFSMILEVFPPQKIGAAMGVAALVIMFAPAIGPTLAGIIIGALSWRYLFFLFAIILFVAMIFVNKYMVNPYKKTCPKIDILSCITSCLGFGGLVLGVGLASFYGWGSFQVIGALVIGVVALLVYIRRQNTMEEPVLNLSTFRIGKFRVGALLVMLNFGITLSAMFILPQYIQGVLLLPVAMTGILLLPGGVVNALVSLGAGMLYDKIGAKIPVTVGFILSIVGTALFVSADKNSGVAFIVMAHIILMIGVPLAMSPAQSSGLKALPAKLSTDGSTILNTMQQVWGAICTAIATGMIGFGQSFYGGEDAVVALSYGAKFGFGFALVLAVIGFIGSFFVAKTDKEAGQ